MAETSRRLLSLLSLLQTPREWPGPELAVRLGVTQRTVRNDVDRLRQLGYPVQATRGPVGGYRLAAGTAMPPLLLEDDEAVAVVVALQSAAGGVAGEEDHTSQALAKLRQVLPKRLARQVDLMQNATSRPSRTRHGPKVGAAVLAALAESSDGREIVRFGYASYTGEQSERRVEPYRLVNLGQRWYLVAFDVVRQDWRTFRVDRMHEVHSMGHRFRARELPAPDVADWVADKTRQARLSVVARVEVAAPAEHVATRMRGWIAGSVESSGPERCRVGIGGRDVASIAFWLGMLDADFEVLDSAELAEAVRRLGQRYLAAAGAPPAPGSVRG